MENCILCDKRTPVGVGTDEESRLCRQCLVISQKQPPSRGRMPKPTKALPGTKEKIKVLANRAERREELWHPLDARYSGSLLEGVRLLERENRMKAGTNKKYEKEENRRRYRADELAWLPFSSLDDNSEDDTELED